MQIHISATTRMLGLLGRDISYSLSPKIHSSCAAAFGIDQVYLPFDVRTISLSNLLEVLWDLGCVGLNVTTPFKSEVAALLAAQSIGRNKVGNQAGKLRSVNTLYRGHSGWEATATDGPGFAAGLKRVDRCIEDFSEIIILGSGGTAQTLLEYFAALEFNPQITVIRRSAVDSRDGNRVAARDTILKECYSADLTIVDLSLSKLIAVVSKGVASTLFIQATSAPNNGDNLAQFVPAFKDFKGVLVDLVYNQPSALYFAMLDADKTALDGEAMLIEQARLSSGPLVGKSCYLRIYIGSLKSPGHSPKIRTSASLFCARLTPNSQLCGRHCAQNALHLTSFWDCALGS